MYLYTKINFLGQGFQKLEHEQDRQTHTQRQTDRRDWMHHHSRIRGW